MSAVARMAQAMACVRPHFSGAIAGALRYLIETRMPGLEISDPRTNGLYGAHELIVAKDGQSYRIIITPIECPIEIGGVPASEHFGED